MIYLLTYNEELGDCVCGCNRRNYQTRVYEFTSRKKAVAETKRLNALENISGVKLYRVDEA